MMMMMMRMEEVGVWCYGIPVATVMLGFPLWRSIVECRHGRLVHVRLFRWWIFCSCALLFSFSLAVAFSTLELVMHKALVPVLPPIPSKCTIRSKGVDLRYARLCEFKDLSWKWQFKGLGAGASRKPPCRLDYYWASILKVEFTPSAFAPSLTTIAEVPKFALPLHCRPGFSSIWRMTENVEVNSTYSCAYTLGRRTSISMMEDIERKCILTRPSTFKLFQEFLVIHSEDIIAHLRKFYPLLWKTLYSVLWGIMFAMIVTILTNCICMISSRISGCNNDKHMDTLYFKARLQLAFLIVTSMFGAVWLGSKNEDLYSGLQLLREVALDIFSSTKQAKLSKGGHD